MRFHALADPTRAAMVERLSHGPAPVSTLAEPFGMALPTILQHLRVLEASGLIRTEKRGRTRTATLNGPALAETAGWITRQAQVWEDRLDRLDALALSLMETSDD
jgi:DNA-binding transcriptional ArsR family regulator